MPPKRAAAACADKARFWDVFWLQIWTPETSVSHTFTHVTGQCWVRNSFAVIVFCDSLEASSCFIISQNLSLYLMYCCIYVYIYRCVHTNINTDIIYIHSPFFCFPNFCRILPNAFHPSRLVQRSALRPKHLQSEVPCRSHLPAPRLPLSPAVDGQVAKVEKWAAEITRPRLKWPQHRI